MEAHPRSVAAAALLGAVLAGCGGSPHDEAIEWRLAGEPQGSTVEVTAYFGGSSCTDFKEWTVDESSTEVEVRAIVTFSGAGDCTADMVGETKTVRLAEPLGSRRLAGCDPDDKQADCATVDTP